MWKKSRGYDRGTSIDIAAQGLPSMQPAVLGWLA